MLPAMLRTDREGERRRGRVKASPLSTPTSSRRSASSSGARCSTGSETVGDPFTLLCGAGPRPAPRCKVLVDVVSSRSRLLRLRGGRTRGRRLGTQPRRLPGRSPATSSISHRSRTHPVPSVHLLPQVTSSSGTTDERVSRFAKGPEGLLRERDHDVRVDHRRADLPALRLAWDDGGAPSVTPSSADRLCSPVRPR